jgi:histidine triad (HIT) family protein
MCIFCNFTPDYKVYEDDQILAFLDIYPVSPGHTLVITKKHYQNLEDISAPELNALIQAVKKIGAQMKERLGVTGYAVTENNDPVAGQIIPHIHFHIIPRQEGDNLEAWPQRQYAAGEAEEILKKLTA